MDYTGKDFVRVTPGFDVYHLGMPPVGECGNIWNISRISCADSLLLAEGDRQATIASFIVLWNVLGE